MTLCLYDFDVNDRANNFWGFIACAAAVVAGRAWMSPVIETLMVIQMKNDPKRGTEDLETFGIFCQSIGAFFYCIVAGAIISRPSLANEEGEIEPQPKLFFIFSAFLAIDIFVMGMVYPKASERHGIKGHDDHHLNEEHGHHELKAKDQIALSFNILTHF